MKHEWKFEGKKQERLLKQLTVAKEGEVIKNPWSGEKVEACPEEVALYDYIKGCEVLGDGAGVALGLDLFSQNWPDHYMTLLD